MADDRDISLKIRAAVEGLNQFDDLVKELNALDATAQHLDSETQELADSLQLLQRQQSLLKQFTELKEKTAELTTQLRSAKDAVTPLAMAYRTAQQELARVGAAQASAGAAATQLASALTTEKAALSRLAQDLTNAREKAAALASAIKLSGQAASEQSIALQQARGRLSDLNSAYARQKAVVHDTAAALRQATAEQSRAESAYQDTERELRRTEKAFSAARGAARELTEQERAQQQQLSGLRKELMAAGISTRELAAAQIANRKAIAATAAALEQQKQSLAGLNRQQQAGAGAIAANNAQLLRYAAGLGQVGAAADQTQQQTARLGGGLDQIKQGLAGLGALAAVQQLIAASDAATQLNQGLELVFGSSEAAAREFAFVEGVANRLGLSLDSVGQSYLSLAASANGTALAGAQTRAIFSAIAGAMAALGKSSAETDQALRAVAQMMSKGTVASEELKGQLGEALPGAFQLAARAMGVTTAELQKMLEAGEVTATTMLPKLARELNTTFGSVQVQTFGAAFNRVMNSVRAALTETADAGVKTFALNMISGFATVVQAAGAIPIALKAVGQGVGEMAGAVAAGDNVLNVASDNAERFGLRMTDLANRLLGVATPAEHAAAMQRDLAQQTDGARTSLEKLQDAAARGDLSALPETLQGVIGALQKTGDAAAAGQSALAAFIAEPQRMDSQKVLEMATAVQMVGSYASGSGEQLRAGLGAALSELSGQQLLELQRQAQSAMDTISQGNAQARASVIGLGDVLQGAAIAAFQKLGIDGNEALTGIDSDARQAISALELLTQSAAVTGDALQQAFAAAIDSATTVKELAAVKTALEQAGVAGKVSGDQISNGLIAIAQKTAEARQQTDPFAQALKLLGIDSEQALTGMDAKMRAIIATLTDLSANGKLTGDTLQQALNNAVQTADSQAELTSLNDLIAKLGEQGKLSGEYVKLALTGIKDKLTDVQGSVDPVAQAFEQLGVTSSQELQEAARSAQTAFAILSDSGRATTGDLSAAFQAMAQHVLAAGASSGPVGLAMAESFLRAKAATADQVAELDKLISKYGETGAAATSAGEQAAASQQRLADATGSVIENIVQGGADAANAGREVAQSWQLIFPVWDQLTETVQQSLQRTYAQLMGLATAGRNVSDSLVLLQQNVQAAAQGEMDTLTRIEALQATIAEGGAAAQAARYEMERLAQAVDAWGDVATQAGEQARQAIQDYQEEVESANDALTDLVMEQRRDLGDQRAYEEYQHQQRLAEINELGQRAGASSDLIQEAIRNENELYQQQIESLQTIQQQRQQTAQIEVASSVQELGQVDLSGLTGGLRDVAQLLLTIRDRAGQAGSSIEDMASDLAQILRDVGRQQRITV